MELMLSKWAFRTSEQRSPLYHRCSMELIYLNQEPVMFTGSLRSNLDPFHEHDDATLWNVLHQVHMICLMFSQYLEATTGRYTWKIQWVA